MRHTNVHNEIVALCQEAADAAALNTVEILSQWLVGRGYPGLAYEMRAAFIINNDDEEPGGVPGEGEV